MAFSALLGIFVISASVHAASAASPLKEAIHISPRGEVTDAAKSIVRNEERHDRDIHYVSLSENVEHNVVHNEHAEEHQEAASFVGEVPNRKMPSAMKGLEDFNHTLEFEKAKAAHHEQIHSKDLVDLNGELAQLDSEADMIPGLGNAADLANRAMDIMNGAAGVIPEDYPFVCVCLITGKCDEPMPETKKTPCPGRIGQKAAATQTHLGITFALGALLTSMRM